jgi:hypothetical protein
LCGRLVRSQTLSNLSISKQQPSDWQKLADVPDDDFERALKGELMPTTSGIIAAHSPARTWWPTMPSGCGGGCWILSGAAFSTPRLSKVSVSGSMQ